MPNRIQNQKNALVTGAARGIGRAIALSLAKEGYNVAVLYLGSEEAAEQTCDEIRQLGRQALCIRCDVACGESCRQAVAQVIEEFGSIDVLVNNAGIVRDSLVLSMKEEDFEQIIKTHMSPLYISVHATRPEVRCQMMNNRFAGELMSKINRLVEAGISIHTQIVCCPGYNDGEVLEQTYRDLEALAPMVETMAVVPVGITKHREHLTPMRLFSKPEAAAIVDKVTVWQQECREKFGKSFVYLGDEFYLLAEKQLPDASWYDGFPQIENGIGLSRSFIDEWQQIAAKTDVCNHSVDAVIPVGTSAYKILQPLLDNFNNKTGSKHSFIPVNNEFFGETINVTGLLVGKDILNAAQGMKRIILPAVVLNQDNLFLDDMSFDDFKKAFDGKVERAVNARELVMLLSR